MTSVSRPSATFTRRLHAEGQSCGQTERMTASTVSCRPVPAALARLNPFTTPEARRLGVLFGVVYFAQGMWYLPNQAVTVLPEGPRSVGRAGGRLLPARHHPLADQAGVRPAVGFRAPLRVAPQELLPARHGAGLGRELCPGRPPRLSVLADRDPLHAHGARPGLHRRAHRRADGREGAAPRAHRRVPGRAVGGDLHRVHPRRRRAAATWRAPGDWTSPSPWPAPFRSSRWSWPCSSCARRARGRSGRPCAPPGAPSARRPRIARSGSWPASSSSSTSARRSAPRSSTTRPTSSASARSSSAGSAPSRRWGPCWARSSMPRSRAGIRSGA